MSPCITPDSIRVLKILKFIVGRAKVRCFCLESITFKTKSTPSAIRAVKVDYQQIEVVRYLTI